MKYIKSKTADDYFIVLDEDTQSYLVIQEFPYAGKGNIQVTAWTDKRMYDEISPFGTLMPGMTMRELFKFEDEHAV
jgi:hypothetical protein